MLLQWKTMETAPREITSPPARILIKLSFNADSGPPFVYYDAYWMVRDGEGGWFMNNTLFTSDEAGMLGWIELPME